MQELRWNPLEETWMIIAPNRDQYLKDKNASCPFCSRSNEIKNQYEFLSIKNKYPILSFDNIKLKSNKDCFYQTKKAIGFSEIILYNYKHTISLCNLSILHIQKIINLWIERQNIVANKKSIKYVLIFENKGESFCTLEHPHSQLIGFPFIPLMIKKELEASKKFFKNNKKCLFCNMINNERKNNLRVVYEDSSFICILPYFVKWPYEIQIYSCRHVQSLSDLNNKEKNDLAKTLKLVLLAYSRLLGEKYPYMMILYQKPTSSKDFNFYHMRIEFNLPYFINRTFRTLSALGCLGISVIPFQPEDHAAKLKNIISQLIKEGEVD